MTIDRGNQAVGRAALSRDVGTEITFAHVSEKFGEFFGVCVFAIMTLALMASASAQTDAKITEYSTTTGAEFGKLSGGESAQLVYSVARHIVLFTAGQVEKTFSDKSSSSEERAEAFKMMEFAGCGAEIGNDEAGKFRDLWTWVTFSARSSKNANRQMYYIVLDGLKNKCGG